jgi:hypothetical protein
MQRWSTIIVYSSNEEPLKKQEHANLLGIRETVDWSWNDTVANDFSKTINKREDSSKGLHKSNFIMR